MSYHTNHFPKVHHTQKGTPYLTEAGVALISVPKFDIGPVGHFIQDFDKEAGFDAEAYVMDDGGPQNMHDADQLVKTAGQLCYLSFGDGRSKNTETKKYLDNIKLSGHGSVMEHANFTMLFYGIDRAVTHELVRHRAGFAFSQVSQRYVDGKCLRFVARPEFQTGELLTFFKDRIDRAANEYDTAAQELQRVMADTLKNMAKRDARKAVNQAARACLPNETEAPIIVTANARGWRHAIEMRASKFADTTIRALFVRVCEGLQAAAPHLFEDYRFIKLADGSTAVETEFRKV